MNDKSEFCYLCGQSLTGLIDDDHVPPRQFYAPEIRRVHKPNLLTIPTHKTCNASYQMDEEYFVHTMAPLAADSYSGRAIFTDVMSRYNKGAKQRLGHKILREFEPRPGGLYLPNSQVVKRYDATRVNRVVWKIVRGLFFHQLERIVPDETSRNIHIVDPKTRPPSVFDVLADRPMLGDYPGVLDYKYTQIPEVNNLHYWALLLWDRIIILVAFHDPPCTCEKCVDVSSASSA